MTIDLRTPEQKLFDMIQTVETIAMEMTSHKHRMVRIMERQDKIERLFMLLAREAGIGAVADCLASDDLEVEK